MGEGGKRGVAMGALLVVAALLFAFSLFRHAGYPLLWQEEAATAVLGARILEDGVPRVYGERGAINPGDLRAEFGVAASGAWRGAPPGRYYAAALVERVAGGVDDPWSRTAVLRVGFALMGCAGLALLFAALWPTLGGRVAGQGALAGGLLLLTGSVSFALHLREVGPLGPTLLLLGAALACVLRLQRARIAGATPPGTLEQTLLLAPTLWLLGCTSTLVSAALLATLLVYAIGRRLRRGRGGMATDLAPMLVALLLLRPVLAGLGRGRPALGSARPPRRGGGSLRQRSRQPSGAPAALRVARPGAAGPGGPGLPAPGRGALGRAGRTAGGCRPALPPHGRDAPAVGRAAGLPRAARGVPGSGAGRHPGPRRAHPARLGGGPRAAGCGRPAGSAPEGWGRRCWSPGSCGCRSCRVASTS